MGYVVASGKRPRLAWRLPRGYTPPDGRDVLLFLPCAKSKPYGDSPFHRAISAALKGLETKVHVCTISEEVGIVPRELEHQVPPYDTYPNEEGIERASRALSSYLCMHRSQYRCAVAYATSRTFRQIVHRAEALSGIELHLLPREGRFRKSSAFFEFMKRRSVLRKHVSGKLSGCVQLSSSARMYGR